MKVTELLNLIASVAKEKGTSEPFIVGGLPRDKIMGRVKEVQDVDLTTGDESIKTLAFYVNQKLAANYPDVGMKQFPDGHSQISIEGMKVDFSSNFKSPQVEPLLKKAGVVDPQPMQIELMSRDFTCNTLLLKLDLSATKDPTGTAINDIKNKIVKTPLPPAITLGNDNKRIVRIIYMATKLGFEVEQPIIDFVAKNPQLIQNSKPRYITDKIHESMDYDTDKTVRLLTQMNLWPYIPISARLAPYSTGKL